MVSKLQLHQPHLSPEAENRKLRNSLRELTEEARNNEETLKRFDGRELSLLGAETLSELLEILTSGMRDSFQLPCISLVLEDGNHELRHLLTGTGIQPEDFRDVLFVDDLERFHPLYRRLSTPWLGPFLGDEHRTLFSDCSPLRSLALVPLIRRGTLVGSLNLGSPEKTRFTRHHATDFLHRLATIAAVCLENTANREHLVISGLTDALTGLHNRRYLERRLAEEVARARRYRHPLSCLFVDADHFKRVNDLYGHSTGDMVLREIALRMKGCLRASDVATRFGGEEFTLLLPQTDAREAFNLAERIRMDIAETPVPVAPERELRVTVSIGVSEMALQRDDGDAGARLMADADAALYDAKRQGRNRVISAPPA